MRRCDDAERCTYGESGDAHDVEQAKEGDFKICTILAKAEEDTARTYCAISGHSEGWRGEHHLAALGVSGPARITVPHSAANTCYRDWHPHRKNGDFGARQPHLFPPSVPYIVAHNGAYLLPRLSLSDARCCVVDFYYRHGHSSERRGTGSAPLVLTPIGRCPFHNM